MQVGLLPHSNDYSHPADRRKLLFYLENSENKHGYEIAQYNKVYDVICVSVHSDLNAWVNYKNDQAQNGNNVKVVFDLSDAFLMSGYISDKLRAIFHYLSGRVSSLDFSYKNRLIRMMKASDVVICGSIEQKNMLSKYHNNIVIVRDYFGQDINITKSDYGMVRNGELHILWEGFSHGNISIFKMLKSILEKLKNHTIHLHIITDSEYCHVGTSHFCQPTYSVLQKIFKNSSIQFHVYDWNSTTFSAIAISCDFALIPIPNDPVMFFKPENKLILLWSLGIPVITSDTPSYVRVQSDSHETMICNSEEDWVEKINELAGAKHRRERYMKHANRYLDENYSKSKILEIWENVINV